MATRMNVAPLYTVEILRLAASIPEPAALERVNGSAEMRAPTCGSIVATEVQLGSDGRVERLNQKVEACAFGQASAAVVASGAIGRNGEEVASALEAVGSWLSGSAPAPEDWPGFAALDPARSRTGRHGAILLPLRALLAAIEDSGR